MNTEAELLSVETENQEVKQDATPASNNGISAPSLSSSKKPSKILPSPRLSVPKQLDAIRAFALAAQSEAGPVTNDQAGKIIDMAAGTIVVCNAFMCEVGLLTRRDAGKFEVSEVAKAYNAAYEWNADTAGAKLAPAFEDKWFTKALIPRLKMRDWSKADAVQTLAEIAGASKDYQANVEMLLEFLSAAHLIKYDGSMVRSAGPVVAAEGKRDDISGGDVTKEDGPKPELIWLNKDRTRKALVTVPQDVSWEDVEHMAKWLRTTYFLEDPTPKKPTQ